jgi:hypothetical protein
VATLFDYLADERERPWLVRALERTLDDAEREAYAALVAPHDPDRAAWLRLEVALHASAAADPADRARFDRLADACAVDWVRILRRDTVLNCGAAVDRPRRVRFAFVCERGWETLAPTADARVRACDDCRRDVHRCDSLAEAEAHARRGDCIAVPRDLVAGIDGFDARHMVGRPDPVGHWAERLFRDE